MKRDLKKILQRAEALGFEVRKTRANHYQIRCEGRLVATTGSTPSDPRSLLNFKAELRRAGWTSA